MSRVYQGFAEYYDLLMQDALYDEWMQFYEDTLQRIRIGEWSAREAESAAVPSGRSRLRVADLGCGTGTITIRLLDKGHHVYGMDLSEDMLAQAQATGLSARGDRRAAAGSGISDDRLRGRFFLE